MMSKSVAEGTLPSSVYGRVKVDPISWTGLARN